MSRPLERKSRANVVSLPTRTPSAKILGLRRRLGHAAVLGGVEYVERLAYSDEVASLFLKLDAKSRKEAMGLIRRVAEKTKASPPKAKPISPDERVKVRWTDEMHARFDREAPRAKNDFDLCARMGLPACCRGAMRAARSRKGIRYATTPAKAAPRAFDLPLAA